MKHLVPVILVVVALMAAPAVAQCPIVTDINSGGIPMDAIPMPRRVGEGSSVLDAMLEINQRWFFSADTAGAGTELWVTDGTPAGTVMVKDINPGPGGARIDHLVECNGRAYFRAYEPLSGLELWSSDGTAAGTRMVKDFSPGTAGGNPSEMICLGNQVFFNANDGVFGGELWVSDGTTAGTALFLDINPGSAGSFAGAFAKNSKGDRLFFVAVTAANGAEVWVTDGTVAGTRMVADVNPGPASGATGLSMINLGNEMLFNATDGVSGEELWKTDGTSAGTVLLRDIRAGAVGSVPDLDYSRASRLGPDIYFAADDGINGRELWKTDGTTAGTVLVADLEPGGVGSYPRYLCASGPRLCMRAFTSVTGTELFSVVGNQVALVKDIWPGGISSLVVNIAPFTGGRVLFQAEAPTTGAELWISDGTASGTVMVKELWPGAQASFPADFTPIANGARVMFTAADRSPAGYGRELYETDGTSAGTRLLKDINPGAKNQPADPMWLASSGGATLYFNADDGVSGRELWKTDASGTSMVKDINPGPGDSSPLRFIDLWTGSRVVTVFLANDGLRGQELWVTDGTAAGTQLVKDIDPGTTRPPSELTYYKGRVYFAVNDGMSGTELWASDGTAAGTVLVRDIEPGFGSSSPRNLSVCNDTLYFAAHQTGAYHELWKSDGTAAGTVMVVDLQPGGASLPSKMTEFGGKVLFSAFGATGEELYITDGTAAGTVLVKDIRPGTASSNPFDLCVFGNLCYFQAADDLAGTELWRTDGTAAGTVMVSDINPGTAGSSPKGMIVAQGRLFFSATSASTGEELFTSDGTANGTVMVNDIFPGLAGSSPSRFVAAGSGVYFSADSGSGLELHVSDGTAAGTGLVCDLNAAAPGSSPTDLTISDGLLYFAASSDIYGRKLFRLGVSPASVEATGVGCGGQAPVLTASHPLLGGTCTISGRGPNTGARLLIAGLPSPPFRVPGLVAADCAIWVNLSLTLVVPLPASANWSIPVGIPNTPSTIGVKVMLQAAHDPLPLSLSNGLQLTIGR